MRNYEIWTLVLLQPWFLETNINFNLFLFLFLIARTRSYLFEPTSNKQMHFINFLSAIFTVISIINGLDFSYDDADNWGSLETDDGSTNYCDISFETQSPININTAEVSACLVNTLDWELNTNVINFNAVNSGHGLLIKPTINDDGVVNNNTYGILKNNFGGEHEEYCLDSFHLHWGLNDSVGSEHTIDGLSQSLELHFVHYSCNYNSLAEAMADSLAG